MNLNRFKPGQLKCVKTLDAPLVVSAGAGSGKTFTLTQRIAWALLPGSAADGGAFLDGIEQVMAITFTEKAAGEIKSRVKATLRAEGMADEALKVDDAWISTIHGMCSRILRTHAVELGIDPAFSVLDPAHADDMLRMSVQKALSSENEFVSPGGFNALFSEYAARSAGARSSDSVEDMVLSLVRVASANPEGCGCFRKPPSCRSVSELLHSMVELIEEARDIALAQKAGDSRDAWLQSADDFLERASSAAPDDAKRLLSFFNTCPWPSGRFGTKEYKAVVKDLQASCASVIQEARCLIAEPLLDELLGLASTVFESYARQKAELGLLDNDDLLIKASQALACYPDIAREYENKFRIIMVDEFQDTDQLQVDMIKRMAGPGACRLCTVGDAQQSIYRFRGADVQVYKNHLASVAETNPEGLIELPDNFRSHGDVLKLVDRVFEQPNVFGKEFMSLRPSRDEKSVKRPFLGGPGRVDVLLSTYPERKGVSRSDMALFEARRIARRFAELREAGHEAGDMVVLLGRMTNAGIYARALREEGFACVIAGGSIFASAPEVRIMQRLAEVIANPHATSALFEVLSSEMFALSADDFIALSTYEDEATGVLRRRSLDRGFHAVAEAVREQTDAVSPQLAHAAGVVDRIARDAGVRPVSAIMADAVVESGWISRLEKRGAEGQSVAANVLKAIRLVEGIEESGATGPSSVAREMASHIAIAKEPPGALSAKGGDFVRIMTVHASKGLEFPIVGLAEMAVSKPRSSAFSCTVLEGKAYVGLLPSRSVSGVSPSSPVAKAMKSEYMPFDDGRFDSVVEAVERAETPLARREILKEHEAEQELQERRRLLYVALTRAKEALVVAMTSARPAKNGDASGIDAESGIYDDIRSALFGLDDFEKGETFVDFGGSAPARIERIDAEESDFDADREGGPCESDKCGEADETVEIPRLRESEGREGVRLAGSRGDVASYSALAEAGGVDTSCFVSDSSIAAGESAASLDGEFWDALGEDLLRDADKATDFGAALHLCAQWAVRARNRSRGSLAMPSRERIRAIAHGCGLHDASLPRLEAALERWFSSDVAKACDRADALCAELPFFISLEEGGERCEESAAIRYLEGSIDLFASWKHEEGQPRRALIVDYKTGGSDDEGAEPLHAKHELQASCYSYVALSRGFESVETLFVRVERPDAARPDQPCVVRYSFDRGDVASLRSRIDEACAELAKQRLR